MPNYIVAIDGGGTKTLGVLYNDEGKELTRVVEGFANFSVDITQSKQHIENAIKALLPHVPKQASCTIQCGIAGISGLKNKSAYEDVLSKTFSSKVSLESDALIALYAAAEDPKDYVVMAIGGTGSVIMVKTADAHHQLGGHGHLLGDEGSAYHLVIQAIKHTIRVVEANQALDALSKAVMDHLQASNLDDVKQFIYSNSKREIASVSQVVAQVAHNHDQTAITLLEHEGKYVASHILNALEIYPTDQPVTIALHGGFIKQAPYVKQTIINILASSLTNITIKEHIKEAVYGAYVLAKAKEI